MSRTGYRLVIVKTILKNIFNSFFKTLPALMDPIPNFEENQKNIKAKTSLKSANSDLKGRRVFLLKSKGILIFVKQNMNM